MGRVSYGAGESGLVARAGSHASRFGFERKNDRRILLAALPPNCARLFCFYDRGISSRRRNYPPRLAVDSQRHGELADCLAKSMAACGIASLMRTRIGSTSAKANASSGRKLRLNG